MMATCSQPHLASLQGQHLPHYRGKRGAEGCLPLLLGTPTASHLGNPINATQPTAGTALRCRKGGKCSCHRAGTGSRFTKSRPCIHTIPRAHPRAHRRVHCTTTDQNAEEPVSFKAPFPTPHDSQLSDVDTNTDDAQTQPQALPGKMLVLCGAPGSGKSTFSAQLSAANPAWERVNQDAFKRGKRKGTRKQCMDAAVRILQKGRNVIIDRCNLEASQRAHFLQLASEMGVAAHAIMFDLAASTCVTQAKKKKRPGKATRAG